jgi:uncharacterized protein DUF4351
MQKTWAEKLEDKGKAVGETVGARKILLHQLRQRFGPLPAEAERRVEQVSSLARLTRLADKVLVARSLEEMGLV